MPNGNSERDSRFHGKLVPPVILLLCALFIGAIKKISDSSTAMPEIGHGLVSVGLLIIIIAVLQFRKAKTGLVPGTQATTVVDSGIFGLTRNPMYLGMAVILLGGAWLSGSFLALLSPMYFIAHIEKNFINSEEDYMSAEMGDAYIDYKKRVRRWI